MKKFLIYASVCLIASALSGMERAPQLSQSMKEPRLTVAPFSQSRCPEGCICPACLEQTNKLLEIVKKQYATLVYIKAQLYVCASHEGAQSDCKSKSSQYAKKQKELAEHMSKEILTLAESARRFSEPSVVSPRERAAALVASSSPVSSPLSSPRGVTSPRAIPLSRSGSSGTGSFSGSPMHYSDLAESTELSPNHSQKSLRYKKEKEKEKSFEEQEQETRAQSQVLLRPDRTKNQYLPPKLNEMF
jgi:hypothetical protein